MTRPSLMGFLAALLAAGPTVPADAYPQWTISGRVSDATGQAVADICAWFYPPSGDRLAIVRTDADGRYSLTGIGGRSLRILYQDCRLDTGIKRYVSEWWNDAPSFSAATVIRTPPDGEDYDISGIDATLSSGRAITGTVRAATGEPLASVCVAVRPLPGGGTTYGRVEFPQTARTDRDGRYRLGVLGPGNYSVGFEDCNANPVYLSETYDSMRGGAPTPVTVTSLADTTGIDATLDLGAMITGTLRDTASGPISSACATVYDAQGAEVDTDRTSSAGVFHLTRLDTGTYRVGFSDCAGEGHVGEFYDDRATLAQATPLGVTRGQVRADINATLLHCSQVDIDADGLNLCDEIELGADPGDADTDDDGLTDGVEHHAHRTSPVNPDTDADRLDDGDEVLTYRSDPRIVDTDGDQFSDGAEVHGGTCTGSIRVPGGSDPTDATSTPYTSGLPVAPGTKVPSAPFVLCR